MVKAQSHTGLHTDPKTSCDGNWIQLDCTKLAETNTEGDLFCCCVRKQSGAPDLHLGLLQYTARQLGAWKQALLNVSPLALKSFSGLAAQNNSGSTLVWFFSHVGGKVSSADLFSHTRILVNHGQVQKEHIGLRCSSLVSLLLIP